MNSVSLIPAAGAPSIPDCSTDESLELTTLFDQISKRPGAWTTMSVVTTFLPIRDAVVLDLQTGCTVGGDFTRFLDRVSKTLPEVSESTSPLSRISALFNRICRCDPSIEKVLYFTDVKSKIEDPDRMSFLNAACYGDLIILQLYLDNGPSLSEKNRGEAIRCAAENGHEAIVSLLLANGAISEEHRGEAVKCAALRGHAGVVSLLLENGAISEQFRGYAVHYAAQKGHTAIVLLLLANGAIPEEYRHEAIVSLFFSNVDIPEEYRCWEEYRHLVGRYASQ